MSLLVELLPLDTKMVLSTNCPDRKQPTLTIVALACRLADHLKRRITGW
jgi:hypothetical protein